MHVHHKTEAHRAARVLTKGASQRPDAFTPTPGEVAAINKLTLRDFTADELWVCTIRACDNQPDRHFERLLPPALEQLGKTFVGRPGLADHRWSMTTQNCRVFASAVQVDPSEKSAVKGEPYTYLALDVYMPRTDDNASMRGDIEAGILKETSIGFFLDYMAELCSICDEQLWNPDSKCAHIPSRDYNGETCLALIPAHEGLEGAENSWVAVPAQPRAGAIRTQKDAEGADQRRELHERKEKAVLSKQLLELLKDPQALAKALEGEDATTVQELVGKLSAAPAQTPTPALAPTPAPTPATLGADAEGLKKTIDDAVKSALAPEAIAKQLEPMVKASLEAQQKQIDELKSTLASKLAPANGQPLADGFPAGGNAGNGNTQVNAAPDSIGARLVTSLLS